MNEQRPQSKSAPLDLSALRQEIDTIDAQITQQFVRRMDIASRVAAYKREVGMPILDEVREEAVLSHIAELAGETFSPDAQMLYRTIFSLSRAHQGALLSGQSPLAMQIASALRADAFPTNGTVACPGVAGAYSHSASLQMFKTPSILYFKSFEGVFQAVESGLCTYGVLPIENSTYGSVISVYDLMRDHRFQIIRSTRLRVDHCLLANRGAILADIREIISHEQAIGQCTRFLAEHPHIRVTAVENTATAAKQVAESGRKDIAAISSAHCAALYGLHTLRDHLQNEAENFTRFICIAKEPAIYEGANRISLMFTLEHKPGTLHRMTERFAMLGLSLLKLESRPIPGSDFTFMFYFDLEASTWDKRVCNLLSALSVENASLIFLGNYLDMGREEEACPDMA